MCFKRVKVHDFHLLTNGDEIEHGRCWDWTARIWSAIKVLLYGSFLLISFTLLIFMGLWRFFGPRVYFDMTSSHIPLRVHYTSRHVRYMLNPPEAYIELSATVPINATHTCGMEVLSVEGSAVHDTKHSQILSLYTKDAVPYTVSYPTLLQSKIMPTLTFLIHENIVNARCSSADTTVYLPLTLRMSVKVRFVVKWLASNFEGLFNYDQHILLCCSAYCR